MGTSNVQAQQREVEQVVRRAERYWRWAGAPADTRARMAEELRRHLLDAVADGRTTDEVVGGDVIGFAAEWANLARTRPWAERLAGVIGVATLTTGLFAATGPLLLDLPVGLDRTRLVFAGLTTAGWIGGEIFRSYRAGLTSQQAAIAGVVWMLIAGVLGGLLLPDPDADGLVVALSTAAAATLIVVGLIAAFAHRQLRRTSWNVHR
jgi:hypothetical protein